MDHLRQLQDHIDDFGFGIYDKVCQEFERLQNNAIYWQSELPDTSETIHALCWSRWPDGTESFRRGYYHENKWNLDWDGSFDNDDAIILYWLPLEKLGITWHSTADGNNGHWQLNQKLNGILSPDNLSQ